MLSKVVLIVSCVYVVQAAFIINAPADEDKDIDGLIHSEVEINEDDNAVDTNKANDINTEVADDFTDEEISSAEGAMSSGVPSARTCTYANCNQVCRSRGYKFGHCVSANICRCYRFWFGLIANDIRLENEVENSKDNDEDRDGIGNTENADDITMEPIPLEENLVSHEADASISLNDCNPAWCDQTCRRMGNTRGVCVNGRCKCDILGLEPLLAHGSQETVAPISLNYCNPAWCDQTCRRMGNTGGVCVNGRCKCDILGLEPLLAHVSQDTVAPISLNDCNPAWCDQTCRRMGNTGGVCVNGRCKCDILGLEPLLAHVSQETVAPISLNDCNPAWCDQTCRGMGNTGGVCVNGRCKCDILGLEPLLAHVSQETVAPISLNDCNPAWCDQTCRRMGNTGGVCVNGRCKCDILGLEPLLAHEVDSKKCIDYQCAETCRRMHYRGGLCTADSCICFM